MSKITNDGLTRSGIGCFIAVPIWQVVMKYLLQTRDNEFIVFYQTLSCLFPAAPGRSASY